jgi:hypothetical protein
MTDSPRQHDAAHVYIEALSATMDPEHFQLLGEMLQQTSANPPPQDPTVEHDIPAEVVREYATIIGIILTGNIDQRVTQTPSGSWAVHANADDIADRKKLADIDAWVAEREELGPDDV